MCLHPGKRLTNNSRVYLQKTVYPKRTHSLVIAAAIEAERTNSCVQGINGISPLA